MEIEFHPAVFLLPETFNAFCFYEMSSAPAKNPHDPLTGDDENGCDRGAIFIPSRVESEMKMSGAQRTPGAYS